MSQASPPSEPHQPAFDPTDVAYFESAALGHKESLKLAGLNRTAEVRAQLAEAKAQLEDSRMHIAELRLLAQVLPNQLFGDQPARAHSSAATSPILNTVPQHSTTVQPLTRVSHTKSAMPDKFNGCDKAPTIANWLFSVRRYLRVTKTGEDERIDIASTFFTGTALDWWHGVEKAEGELIYRWSWSDFEARCLRRFQGVNESQLALHRLLKWKQTSSLNVYLAGFQAMAQQVPSELLPEPTRIFVFTEGLNNELQKSVRLMQPTTLDEAIGVAQRASVTLQPVSQFFQPSNRYSHRQPSTMARASSQINRAASGSRFAPLMVENMEDVTQPNVNYSELNYGHTEGTTSDVECSALTAEQRKLFRENKCFKCKRVGHRLNDCPTSQWQSKEQARV
jgi:hypothetical protein